MERRAIFVAVLVVSVLATGWAARAEAPAPIGTVLVVTGTVEVGRDGVWQPAMSKAQLFDGQVIGTAAGSGVEILFDGAVPAKLGEKAEIAVADLQLKAQLEQAKAKIAPPADATKAEMQVTPLTGLRELKLTNNRVTDLLPLVYNTGLDSGDVVYLEGNPLSQYSREWHVPTLEARCVTVYR